MNKVISNIDFDDTLSLVESTDGWLLYDTTKYYQEKLLKIKNDNKRLQSKIDYINQLIDDE